jgi:hypothetical protein
LKCAKEEFKPCIHAGFGKISDVPIHPHKATLASYHLLMHVENRVNPGTYHLPYLACLGDKSADVVLDPEGELDGLPGDGLQARASTKSYANFL